MPYRRTLDFTGNLDKLAAALSGLCLVHCLLLPLAVALFPVLGASLIPHETFHQIILVFVVPTSALALGFGYRHHRSRTLLALGGIGVAALAIAAFAIHAAVGEDAERIVTVAGSLLLAAAHVGNFRRTRHRHHQQRETPAPARVDSDPA